MDEDICNDAVSRKYGNVKTHSLWELIEIDAQEKKKDKSGKKANKCNHCEHESVSPSALEIHLRSHSAQCAVCTVGCPCI